VNASVSGSNKRSKELLAAISKLYLSPLFESAKSQVSRL
jgi:hypothetical protein